jgi:DNA (cytosine-5)-methyltransferase 1
VTELLLNDWFCGAGGATQGAHSVPGVRPVLAANHDQLAIDTHSTNFPDVEHFRGDIRDLDVAGHPYAHIFWASPECTNWSQAKGKAADYARQPGLFDEPEVDEDVMRSRALMQDVIRYLRGMDLRQEPVLAGVVENVIDIRKWTLWHAWRREIEVVGYRTRLIALNSMHAQSQWTPRAPQSRDRLYLAYWHEKLGRDPDWDRWLRPAAHCPSCDQRVAAVQHWKRQGNDMGRYRQQYVYVCPHGPCRGQIVEPEFVPAAAAIDWTLPGERIGDKARPLAPKTLARIEAGIRKYARPIHLEAGGNQYDSLDPNHPQHGRPGAYVRAWPADSEPLKALHTSATKAVAVPMLVPAGGTWNDSGQPVTDAMRTRTTRETDGVLVPPLVVPLRTHGTAAEVNEPLKTFVAGNQGMAIAVPPMTLRNFGAHGDPGYLSTPVSQVMGALTTKGHQSLVVPPFLTILRGRSTTQPIDQALSTVSTMGAHHALVTMQAWAAVYRYDNDQLLNHLAAPLPTQTTIEGDAIVTGEGLPAVEDCLFRMLEPHEIHAGMAFVPDYVVLGNKRQKVRQLGNAVTPPVAEVLVSALVECITGEPIERAA